MRINKLLTKITILSAAFALDLSGIIIHKSVTPTMVEAAQHINNYDEYTYSGTYYNTLGSNLTDGLNGTLRTSLTTLTYPKAWYNYSNNLPDMLPDADQDPTNSSNMVLFYSRDSVSKNTSASWNKEHVWPQSKSNGNISTSAGAGSDLLHIRPTYNDTNSKRGSLMMGDVADSYAVYYSNMLYGYCINNSKFEPIDAVKGDVARIFMYLWTAYRNQFSLNMLDVIESYNTLLTWHTLDKPDALEARRNQYAQDSNQKNRNPFVDHPEYAWRIFAVGNSEVSDSVKNACMTAYPADGYTPGPNGGEGEEESAVTKATAIEVGDTVVLTTSSSYSKQFSGISTTSTKYGMTADFSGDAPDGTSNALEVVQGYNSSTFAFKYNDNYLCWSSGNSLDVKGTLDANSSWNVSFSGENAIITNAADSTRIIRYNTSSPRFACYTSGQADVALWKVTGGGSVDPDPITPTGITLNTNSVSLEVGEEETLTATLSPNGATGNVIWSSGDESVATVEDGVITAVGGGSTTIFATVEGVSGVFASCSVTVSEPEPLEGAYLEALFGSINNSQGISSYENSWYSINNGFRVDVINSNNNNNGWNGAIAFGSKIKALTSSITTHSSISNPVSKVAVNLTQAGSSDKINSFKLQYSQNASTWTDVDDFTYATGEKVANIPSPQANMYYRVLIDIAQTGSNGICKLDSIKYYLVDNGETPVNPDSQDEIEALPTQSNLSYTVSKSEGSGIKHILNNANAVKDTSSNYNTWSYKDTYMGINYTGQSAGGNSAIQLRSNNNNSGVVTSLNNKSLLAKSITVKWNGATGSGRVLDVYGKNTAYSAPTDLYATSTQGTKIGSLTYSGSNTGTLTFDNSNSYAFIGIRSNSGAIWLDSIEIQWGNTPVYTYSEAVIRFGGSIDQELWGQLAEETNIISYGMMFSEGNLNLKDLYNTKRAASDSIDEAITAMGVINRSTAINSEHETPTAVGTNYVWNLCKRITSQSDLTKQFSAMAYIRIEDDQGNEGIILLQSATKTVKQLAQEMLDGDKYDENAFGGSLYKLAHYGE